MNGDSSLTDVALKKKKKKNSKLKGQASVQLGTENARNTIQERVNDFV